MTRLRMTDGDVAAAVAFLQRRAGLVFDEGRRPGLTAVLARRVREAGFSDLAPYLLHVDGENGAQERQRLLDDVTIQETFFFRNGPQMAALRTHVLPELIAHADAQSRPLRVWSAGCSTGEEPYTLAMVASMVREAMRSDVDLSIIGSDVSASALVTARSAAYAGRTVELADDASRARWLIPDGSGVHRVSPEVAAHVDFALHNLVTDPPLCEPGTMDLIVCRNVTIYFAKPTTAAVIAGFHQALRPGGYLLLGHAETLWQISDAFTLVPVGEAFVYRRAPVAAPRVATTAAPQSTAEGDAVAGAGTGAADPRRESHGGARGPRPRKGGQPGRAAATVFTRSARTRREATAAQSQARIDRWLGDAELALDDGRYATALELARRVLSEDDLAVPAYAVAGRAAIALGEDSLALEPLRKAVFLEPACAEAHFLLAGVLDRAGQHQPAAAAYRAAATAVATTAPERLHRMVDGRSPETLVALCHQLAIRADGAEGVGASVASTPWDTAHSTGDR